MGAALAPEIVRALLLRGIGALDAWLYVGAALLLTCVGMLLLAVAGPVLRAPDAPEEDADKDKAASKSRFVFMTGAFLFVYVGIEVSFGGYIDVFSVRWLDESKVQGATLTSIYWGALCVGRAVAALVTPFVHHARYLAWQLLLAIASAAALWVAAEAPTEDVEPGSSGWWLGVVAPTACFGFTIAPLFPGALLVVEELLGHALPARDAGRVVGAAAAGEMTLPLLVGALFSVSPISFCWSQLVLCAGAALIFFTNSGSLLTSKAKQ